MVSFPQDFITIGLLVFLEGILSIDNAIVLALLASRLPRNLRKKALLYGLGGAVVFRLIALAFAVFIMRWVWIKFVGGGYLMYVAIAHWVKGDSEMRSPQAVARSFWKTVVVIFPLDL